MNKTARSPLKGLLEDLELALKFGNVQDIESAGHALLAHTKDDIYEIKLLAPDSPVSRESSNLEVLKQFVEDYRGDLKGASLKRTCGHCQHEEYILHGSGKCEPAYRWTNDYLLKNWPEEL